MNGKEKCEMLRSIRMNIAQKYGIEYEPKECEHTVCSTGTCPLCDKEAKFILEELRKRKKAGELDRIDTQILGGMEYLSKEPTDEETENLVLIEIANLSDENSIVGEIYDEPEALMGDIAAPEDDDQDGDDQEDDDHPLPHP